MLGLLVVAFAVCVALYLQGFGMPSQQAAIDGAYRRGVEGGERLAVLGVGHLRPGQAQAMAGVPEGSSHEIEGLDTSVSASAALVRVTLPEGGR